MSDLSMSELKVLLIIIRKTLGWKGDVNGRKKRDWISSSQLTKMAGISRRAITTALSSLVKKGLIRVTNLGGHVLVDGCERKGKTKLYFELNSLILGENLLKECDVSCDKAQTSEITTQNIGKKVQALAQKLLITK